MQATNMAEPAWGTGPDYWLLVRGSVQFAIQERLLIGHRCKDGLGDASHPSGHEPRRKQLISESRVHAHRYLGNQPRQRAWVGTTVVVLQCRA